LGVQGDLQHQKQIGLTALVNGTQLAWALVSLISLIHAFICLCMLATCDTAAPSDRTWFQTYQELFVNLSASDLLGTIGKSHKLENLQHVDLQLLEWRATTCF